MGGSSSSPLALPLQLRSDAAPFVLEVFSGGRALANACLTIGLAACAIGLHNLDFSRACSIPMDMNQEWAQKYVIDLISL